MKTLGVDPGTQRIGLALSDEGAGFARPLCILKHISLGENASRILQIARDETVERIVIGVPYDSDGGLGPRARASMRLMEAIHALEGGVELIAWDESHSTQKVIETERVLGLKPKRRREPKDDHAAAMILQDYLDANASSEGGHA